ncbi:MAG: class I SAM-dependent methyltransferase [Candidatus Eisenbacteria bacterium]|nr:class I SAM-dependent methyltransferase [Candidatus Eisenbacteria bacterium]
MTSADSVCFLDKEEVRIGEFPDVGPVLDIGGGGEGIVGLLAGEKTISVDRSPRELKEAPEGPRKVAADARALPFPDRVFPLAVAFFTLLYLPGREDLDRLFEEAARTLRPEGRFLIWDAELPVRPDGDTSEAVALPLRVIAAGREIETGYGVRWPRETRAAEEVLRLARRAGFEGRVMERSGRTYRIDLRLREER